MDQEKVKLPEKKETENKKPDETCGYYFSSAIKIFDPNTSKVFVQKRADE